MCLYTDGCVGWYGKNTLHTRELFFVGAGKSRDKQGETKGALLKDVLRSYKSLRQ
jgi:hypothetical protein